MAPVDWPPGPAGRLDGEQSIASWSAAELQHLRARRQECDDVGYKLFMEQRGAHGLQGISQCPVRRMPRSPTRSFAGQRS